MNLTRNKQQNNKMSSQTYPNSSFLLSIAQGSQDYKMFNEKSDYNP